MSLATRRFAPPSLTMMVTFYWSRTEPVNSANVTKGFIGRSNIYLENFFQDHQEDINAQAPPSTKFQLLLVLGKRVASDGDTPLTLVKKKIVRR